MLNHPRNLPALGAFAGRVSGSGWTGDASAGTVASRGTLPGSDMGRCHDGLLLPDGSSPGPDRRPSALAPGDRRQASGRVLKRGSGSRSQLHERQSTARTVGCRSPRGNHVASASRGQCRCREHSGSSGIVRSSHCPGPSAARRTEPLCPRASRDGDRPSPGQKHRPGVDLDAEGSKPPRLQFLSHALERDRHQRTRVSTRTIVRDRGPAAARDHELRSVAARFRSAQPVSPGFAGSPSIVPGETPRVLSCADRDAMSRSPALRIGHDVGPVDRYQGDPVS